ncbi:toll/interleukin-1 receptor domain-containing protein [Caldimonas manganoxidans]|uniref:toll/interleukin-1 receptor domain-containing protein n=1 Tax=Caldimonas manganoxidans TaxID=196015 RepID=UPI00037F4423|nr:toll/interleukin-1 receptor domain-containing protein [Caldimonas manganoxidans]
MTAPKVFVSHASEDKARFVVDFARRLRENGVDAWLDQWEMKPGDSLVDKIFEEGLKEARAVVIVLSATSVQKPWVREELNASVVNRLSRGTKLIPVVIDDCEVPEALRSTVWQKVDNLNDYGASLQRILSVIFDVTDKPALGAPPARFAGPAPLIAGLSRVDDLVIRVIARIQIDEGAGLVEWDRLKAEPLLRDVPQQELLDSLQILEQHHFVKVGKVIGAPLSHVVLTDFGFLKFAEAYVDDYQGTVNQIAALLVNEDVRQNQELAARVNKPVAFVDFVLNLMESNNYIKVSKYLGGQSHVWEVSASLRRALQSV